MLGNGSVRPSLRQIFAIGVGHVPLRTHKAPLFQPHQAGVQRPHIDPELLRALYLPRQWCITRSIRRSNERAVADKALSVQMVGAPGGRNFAFTRINTKRAADPAEIAEVVAIPGLAAP